MLCGFVVANIVALNQMAIANARLSVWLNIFLILKLGNLVV